MRYLGALLLAGLVASCGDSNQQPSGAGDLLVSYSGTGEAGAMVIVISGGAVQEVHAVGTQQVSFSAPYSNTTRVVVIGAPANGDLLRIRVPDVSHATSYSVRAEQVADNTTFALIDPARHTFSVHR